MSAPPLRLLGRASSINVRKVLWTCAELGLAVAREDWGQGFRPTDDPAFLALNPQGLVPVLVDGEFVLPESNTICRYLVARAGRDDLLPAAPRERAVVERWMDWQATELNSAWRYPFMSLVRGSPAHRDGAALAAGVLEWNRQMGLLEQHLQAGAEHVGGPGFTVADVVLGLSVQRWLATPLPQRPELPAVRAYHLRLSQRDAFLQTGCADHP